MGDVAGGRGIEFAGFRTRNRNACLHGVGVPKDLADSRPVAALDVCDGIAGAKLPFTRDAQVEAAAPARAKARDDVLPPQADAQLEAGLSRPRDDELGRADA